MAESYYTPGVCNINPTETAYRRKFAIGLGAAGVVLLVLGLLAKVHPAVGIVLFLPFWLSSVNVLQSRNHFCVAYASSGKYNNGDGMGAVADATAEQHAGNAGPWVLGHPLIGSGAASDEARRSWRLVGTSSASRGRPRASQTPRWDGPPSGTRILHAPSARAGTGCGRRRSPHASGGA